VTHRHGKAFGGFGIRSAAAGLALLGCLLATPFGFAANATAHTRSAAHAAPSTLELPGPAGRFPDRLIRRARPLARLQRRSDRALFAVAGGQRVEISSTHYSDAAMQGVANVLGGLVHGPEMSALSVYLATPGEIEYICGPQALACYAPFQGLMVVSGENKTAYGVPRDYTIAHEYGHHIATNRLNPPWGGLEVGGKRWATYTGVCQSVRRGQLFPGDEDLHYWENPGEAFAETNAHLNYPEVSVPWGYSPLLRPSQGSIAALHADITSPWTDPVTVTWNGAQWPQRRFAVRRFSMPLDGMVQVRLRGPEGANYDLYALGPKLRAAKKRVGKHSKRVRRAAGARRRVLARGVSGDSSEQLDLTLCGQDALRVEVRRRSGSGPFTVSVTRP
jgi:hypothetical protein